MLKRISFALCLMLAASAAFAGIKSLQGYSNATFYQFGHDHGDNEGDYRHNDNPKQNWEAAQQIRLIIPADCELWVSNYVDSWYSDIKPLDDNVFEMVATVENSDQDLSKDWYGAQEIDGDGKRWVGTGETREVTYIDDDTSLTNTTDAYYVGEFEEGDVIYLWMTTLPEDDPELAQVDMQQAVADPENDTPLLSRTHQTFDQAGNVRINFGIDSVTFGSIGREFVAFGVSRPPSGQPLPGVMATTLLAMGTVAAAARKKLRKRA